MQIETEKYYHLYNRTNNRETAFKSPDNYIYFLSKYKKYVQPYVTTLAYCLMPTHFHFLIKINTAEIDSLRSNIGVLLSSYTKAINKSYQRNGSLFQKHSKTIEVDDESYLITLCMYIHQNPVRAKLAARQEEWMYSSYQSYAGIKSDELVDEKLLMNYFQNSQKFRQSSEEILQSVQEKYWI